MAARARRLALLATAATVVLGLSGCTSLWRVGGYPPPHANPASTATADTAAGRAFTGRADGDLNGYRVRHGFTRTKLRAGFIGTYNSDLTGSPLQSADWHARFKMVRNRVTRKAVTTGLVLATFDDATAGRACLKLSHEAIVRRKGRRLKRSRGKVTVVGGEGGARTLYGTARARVRLARNGSALLSGRVRSHQGEERGFTRACKRLERKFGLQPLPDA